jgi:hypothetical protein
VIASAMPTVVNPVNGTFVPYTTILAMVVVLAVVVALIGCGLSKRRRERTRPNE